jgi:hypothetical protein
VLIIGIGSGDFKGKGIGKFDLSVHLMLGAAAGHTLKLLEVGK